MSLEAELRSLVRDEVRDVLREELQVLLQDRGGIRNAAEAYLSIAKAARVADVAPGTVRAWIRSGRVESRRAGRVLRVSRTELERFMALQPSEAQRQTISRRADAMVGSPCGGALRNTACKT